jgi:hypothetical protein
MSSKLVLSSRAKADLFRAEISVQAQRMTYQGSGAAWTRPWSAGRAILVGMLIVGTLDALDAIVVFGLRGATPAAIFRSIAAGLVGRQAAAQGGLETVLLGVALHYFIAFGIVSVYYLASRVLPVLARHPFRYGPIYGVLVYFFMNLVVIPLSAIGPGRGIVLNWLFVNGIFIHIVGVGLPSALVVSRTSPASRTDAREPAARLDGIGESLHPH